MQQTPRGRAFRSALLASLLSVTAACHEGSPASPLALPAPEASAAFPGMTVYATSANASVAESFFEFLPEASATVETSSDPLSAAAAAAGKRSEVQVALVTDLRCGECYQLGGGGLSYQVHGGNALGAQYGLAQLLEELGFRFFHPWQSKAPTTFVAATGSKNIGPLFTPEMTLRGLHLHTQHPIESYWTFWASSAANGGSSDDSPTGVAGARRVIDWIVKNRGNFVEWAALNNIVSDDPADVATWRSHESAILDYAHARGIKVGIMAELFGVSNLQLAYDFLDNETTPNAGDPSLTASVDNRVHVLTDGLPWDILDLSFGEFTGTDPQVFISSVNLVYTELEKIVPGTEMSATVHVGNDPSLEVTYDGQTVLYYFLVKYCDPQIVPWIHTVMYFDFYQPVDGAYNMPNFDQHLAYLQSRLMANQPVAYYPESAYWISFDDSVPTYLPVYMRSRWLDQSNLASASAMGGYSTLQQSVLFSSGWEWGYWQNDYAVLRMNFTTPAAWSDPLADMFAPWGAAGAALVTQITALGELQSKYLIDEGLAAYIAGDDAVITLGAVGGIISQPPRTSFAALGVMTSSELATFTASVLTPLGELDSATQSIQAAVDGLGLDATDPWLAEAIDGFDIDADRTHFMLSLYSAVATYAATGSDGGWLEKADSAMADAKAVVARRDAALHYPNPNQILAAGTNSTFYQSGYLTEAGTLCYWNREQIQALQVIHGDGAQAPGCVP